ncbi:MAG: hypothetical protein JJV94_03265 [Sulfurospirillum sp.]|nr:hypothetical protein [Sulfurospirillum sp.]
MRKKLLIALTLVSAIMFSGCATIFGGAGKQNISISSDSTKRMKAKISYTDGSSPQYLTIPGTVSVKKINKNIIIRSQDNDFEERIIKKRC